MSSFDKSQYVHSVFSKISDYYDVMNDLESLGLHRLWKARLVRELSHAVQGEKPICPQGKREYSRLDSPHILDIACGTGDITIALAQALPQATITGLDFNEAMLKVARRRVAQEMPLSFIVEVQIGVSPSCRFEEQSSAESVALRDAPEILPLHPEERSDVVIHNPVARSTNNLRLIQGNAMDLPFSDESMDAVSISFGLRNMPDYAQVLAEIFRVLKPGGMLFCLEASYPTNRLVKPPFKLYFKYWLQTLAKVVVKSPEEYSWLNTSTEAFLSKDELTLLMQQTGFSGVHYTSFLFGAVALHRGIRP